MRSPNRIVLLLGLIFIAGSAAGLRGKPIDIFGSENGGGDILHMRQPRSLSPVQRSMISSPVQRNAIRSDSSLKWSKMIDSNGNFVIPYVISGLYDQLEREVIDQAIDRINNNTCIRYRPRANERDYVDIRNQRGEGCYTNVGRYTTGANVLMLEANDRATCIRPYTVLHEMLHTVGLWHEHMRIDRDKYIQVLYDNIEPVYFDQFVKVPDDMTTTYGIPYDYTSIMHYAENAFAKRGRISMRTRDASFQKRIGRNQDASDNDYRKICLIYDCKTCMGQPFNAASFQSKDPSPVSQNQFPLPEAVLNKNGNPLPPILVVQPDCADSAGLCPMLKSHGMLNCNWMGNYCCASCRGVAPQMPVEAQTTTTTFPPESPSIFDRAWGSIKSFFG